MNNVMFSFKSLVEYLASHLSLLLVNGTCAAAQSGDSELATIANLKQSE
jgi:hypothetical protein